MLIAGALSLPKQPTSIHQVIMLPDMVCGMLILVTLYNNLTIINIMLIGGALSLPK